MNSGRPKPGNTGLLLHSIEKRRIKLDPDQPPVRAGGRPAFAPAVAPVRRVVVPVPLAVAPVGRVAAPVPPAAVPARRAAALARSAPRGWAASYRSRPTSATRSIPDSSTSPAKDLARPRAARSDNGRARSALQAGNDPHPAGKH